MSDFAFPPTSALTGETAYRVLSAQFGDGYKQALQDGINNLKDTWAVVFDPSPIAQMAAIKAFLAAKAGATSFTWTPPAPDNTEISVRCANVSTGFYRGGAVGRLTLAFERVYVP